MIVSINSDAGRMGEYRKAVYSACKAGIIALSKSIARETGRYGLRANAVVFLASGAASFITGHTLSVSGGYTMM